MLLQAIGAGIPLALAIALSPFPVIGVVLILAGRHGRIGGAAFAAGWIVGLSAATMLITIASDRAVDPDTAVAAIVDWGRVVVGAMMIFVGLRKGRRIAIAEAPPEPPAWMATIDSVAPLRAFGLGVGLAGANPKNMALAAAAATATVEAGVEGGQLVAALAVFVFVGSVTVVGAVLVHTFGGRRGRVLLDRVRRFMVDHGSIIMILVLVLLGAKVLGDGLIGLGR